MRLFGIIVILFSLLSCQSRDTAHTAYDDGVGNDREITPVWPDSGPILLAKPLCQRPSETLHNDEIARWKQIAVEAATSTAAWSRFGGKRFIETPFNVDPTQIEYRVVGESCSSVGKVLVQKSRDANYSRIKVIVPTDYRSVCASFYVEVIVDRELGKVVDMKDSFLTLSMKERKENGCLTRLFDKPV